MLVILGVVSSLSVTPAPLAAQRTPSAPTPSEKRIAPVTGAQRTAALRDAQYARRAMQLTAVQEQSMAAVRARYAPAIKAYIARLNAMVARNTSRDSMTATEDTLRTLITTEHAALDSLLTPVQKQRFADAMRQAHAVASAPPSTRSSHAPSSAVPIPAPPATGSTP